MSLENYFNLKKTEMRDKIEQVKVGGPFFHNWKGWIVPEWLNSKRMSVSADRGGLATNVNIS